MAYCYECGSACTDGGTVPVCPAHGPRWKLVRNAPCASALVVRDGRVLLGRRARNPWRGEWEVPGGFVELGEHPTDAARRETFEELGIRVRLTGMLGEYLDPAYDGQWLQVSVYTAETDDEPVADPEEVTEVRWFSPGELPERMAGGHRRRVEDWLAGRREPDRPER